MSTTLAGKHSHIGLWVSALTELPENLAYCVGGEHRSKVYRHTIVY